MCSSVPSAQCDPQNETNQQDEHRKFRAVRLFATPPISSLNINKESKLIINLLHVLLLIVYRGASGTLGKSIDKGERERKKHSNGILILLDVMYCSSTALHAYLRLFCFRRFHSHSVLVIILLALLRSRCGYIYFTVNQSLRLCTRMCASV